MNFLLPLLPLLAGVLTGAGLLCLALSQHIHFHHPVWSVRLNRLRLNTATGRKLTGALLLLSAAALLACQQGPGFGLVLWLMLASVMSVVVAWLLAPSR